MNSQIKKNKYGLSFLVFGLLCLITAGVFSLQTGTDLKQSFPATGGKFGPIKIEQKNEVVDIAIAQNVGNRHWSVIDAEVIDENEKYLFAFGDELWFEAGRDSEGRWQEGKLSYDLTTTFPEPGNYYINFSAQTSDDNQVGYIHVKASKKVGSSLAHLWLGWISLIIGIGMLVVNSGIIKVLNQLG